MHRELGELHLKFDVVIERDEPLRQQRLLLVIENFLRRAPDDPRQVSRAQELLAEFISADAQALDHLRVGGGHSLFVAGKILHAEFFAQNFRDLRAGAQLDRLTGKFGQFAFDLLQ